MDYFIPLVLIKTMSLNDSEILINSLKLIYILKYQTQSSFIN